MFSKSCEYGLQAMLYISIHGSRNRKVGLREIASGNSIPVHFLSKILQQLVRYKYLGSSKGKKGGFYLMKSPEKISLYEIVAVFDGLKSLDRCSIGLHGCSEKNPCPVHHKFREVKIKMKRILKGEKLSEIAYRNLLK